MAFNRHAGMVALGALLAVVSCGAEPDGSTSGPEQIAQVTSALGTNCSPLRYPWDESGITAAWHTQDGSVLTIVSRDRLWNLQWSNDQWIFAGKVKDVYPFTISPTVDGRHPWEGPGITAAWHTQDNTILTIISRDLWWNLRWQDLTWLNQGHLRDLPPFPQAPPINGMEPWDGPGITAAWHTQDGSILTIVSETRLWNMQWSNLAWITHQPVNTVPPLSGAHRCCNDIRDGNGSSSTGNSIDNLLLWDGAGITAAWHTPDNQYLTLVNESRLWNLQWATNAFTTDTPLFLQSVFPFPNAPGVVR